MTILSGSSLIEGAVDAMSVVVQVEDARDGRVVLEAVLALASRRRWGGTYFATEDMVSV